MFLWLPLPHYVPANIVSDIRISAPTVGEKLNRTPAQGHHLHRYHSGMSSHWQPRPGQDSGRLLEIFFWGEGRDQVVNIKN